MSQGRSIRLFLVDGTPNGLLTAEIMSWTGHVLTGPRSKLAELVQRPECGRTGVYFLVGPDPENNLRSKVYIGESDDVAKRLKQHNRAEASEGTAGGKDFWEKVCLVTSKDQNLTKTHVKHLESLLIGIVNTVGRCELVNGTAHDYGNLPESDRADMAFFLAQIRTVLPVLGFDFLRELVRPSSMVDSPVGEPLSASPRFVMTASKYGASAAAQEIDGEFVVLKGSTARAEWGNTAHSYENLFKLLVADGVLQTVDGGRKVFTRDYAFSSPSAAAAVIHGRAANGRIEWTVESTGQTYAAWQDQQLNSVTPEPETA